MDFSRIQSDIVAFIGIVQDAIGGVMLNGFGITTTETTNQVIFYLLIIGAIGIGLRVHAVKMRYRIRHSSDQSRRLGLQRYKQG